jgi:Domain of unknown function (DUF927)
MSPIQEYFQRVVALSPGAFFSVHYRSPGRPGIPGRAYQDFAFAEQDIRTWVKGGCDVYLAMGAQRDCGMGSVAIRQRHNTIAARCLYMDIDVKPDAYDSTLDAVTAFNDFQSQAQLPPPTLVVQSGTGGFHVYWTLSELITPEEHYKLSHQLSLAGKKFGLKFDSKCTTDLVRLLRVPDTKNFKTDPPSPVTMRLPLGKEVDVDVMRAALAPFAFIAPKSNPKSSPNDDLRTGTQYRRVTIDQAAECCPFIKETLDSGGANLVDEPQWHAMTALACHVIDPSPTIHKLCEKNQYYNHDDTEKKLAQAQSYRDQNPTLGPPKCVALQSIGAPHCDTCPHLALNTTPLAVPFLQTAPLNGQIYLGDLPSGYFRDSNNHICIEETEKEGGKPERVEVFPYPLFNNSGYLEDGLPVRLTFATWQGERRVQKTVSAGVFSDKTSFIRAFLERGLSITRNDLKSRMFFMNYIKFLQSRKQTMVSIPPLGWSVQDGVWGFAFDGEFVTPKSKYPCQSPGRGITDYKAVGSDQVWRDMAKMVLTPNRPDLMVLAASAFAAPLVKMSGQHGYLIGAWSSASGIGKTTALMLAQSVWAFPAMGGFTDTINYTFDKCVRVQNLPVIYDEIKGDQQTANFVRLVFEMTGGREKGRLDRSGQMKETRVWFTNIAYATNSSIISAVADQTQGTHASVYRVFEFQALNLANKNKTYTTDMARLTTKLNENYGCIGKIYAEYLGQNHDKIYNQLIDFQGTLEKKLSAQNAERCWIAAMSTTLLGAKLAVRLGLAPFDLKVMYDFMLREFERMRNDQRLSVGDYTNPEAVYNELGILLEEKRQNVVLTDQAWTQRGRPPKNWAKVLNDKPQWGEIGIQISGSPLTLRIRDAFLTKWCHERKRQKSALLEALGNFTGADRKTGRLASGTHLVGIDELIVVIPITGTPLEDRCEYAIQRKDIQP